MKYVENLANILIEDIDDEILSRMPEWFIILREAYKRRLLEKFI